jgi:hypothetical protein
MGYAVIQIVEAYHPEGRTDRPKTTEFTHWIFETRKEANEHKKDLMLASPIPVIIIRKTPEEAWVPTNLTKKKKKETA